MKSFQKYKFILFAYIVVLIFQTGCVNDSPISTIASDTTQNTQDTEMNFTQIQAGDYSSLLGTWKEIAYADNLFDGTGQQWHTGRSGTTSSLSVSTDKIDFNKSAMIIQGNMLTDGRGSYPLLFVNYGTSLDAELAGTGTADTWNITFYPKGEANNLDPNNGVQIDNTKNIIVVYYRGMRVLTVFGLE